MSMSMSMSMPMPMPMPMPNVLHQIRLKKEEYDKEFSIAIEKCKIIKHTLLKEYNERLSEYRKRKEKYNKNYKSYDHDQYFLEREKIDKEYDLLIEMRDEILDTQKTCREYKKKCDKEESFYINSDICTIIQITKQKANNLSRQTRCGLCLEQHSIQHLMKTSCGHLYGKKCFSALLKHHFNRGEKDILLMCPLCRNKEFTLYCYHVNKKS